jgi:hypothetical protein
MASWLFVSKSTILRVFTGIVLAQLNSEKNTALNERRIDVS